MPLPVLTKRDFTRRYRAGEFGNRAPTWDTVEEFLAADYAGKVHLRNRIAGGPTWYNVEAGDVLRKFRELRRKGVRAEDLYFSGMAPHEFNTIQGEVAILAVPPVPGKGRDGRNSLLEPLAASGTHVLYSTLIGLPMREALAREALRASGILATLLLRRHLDPGSYDWLQYLLGAYPGHTIEFSCFSRPWGTIPRRNTVIWEVRAY